MKCDLSSAHRLGEITVFTPTAWHPLGEVLESDGLVPKLQGRSIITLSRTAIVVIY